MSNRLIGIRFRILQVSEAQFVVEHLAVKHKVSGRLWWKKSVAYESWVAMNECHEKGFFKVGEDYIWRPGGGQTKYFASLAEAETYLDALRSSPTRIYPIVSKDFA